MTTAPPIIDQTTILSLLTTVAFLAISYQLSLRTLSRSTPRRLRILFVWHAFDFLIHTFLEGSFLYNCFFTWGAGAGAGAGAAAAAFLSRPDRQYGAAQGDNWAARLWMVYARADRRWAGADPTLVSLEMLTVGAAGPLAAYVCWGIQRRDFRVAFWMVVLATAELYGGFMTFSPEWLTGNQNLDGSNFMYLWVYLVFFNMLWVVFPIYALWVSYQDIYDAFTLRNKALAARSELDKDK